MLTTNIKTIDDFEKVFGGNLTENKINEIFEKYSNFIIQDEDKLVYTIKPLNSQDSEVYLSNIHDDIFVDMDEKPNWFLYAMDSYKACIEKKEEMLDEIQMPLKDGTNPIALIENLTCERSGLSHDYGYINRDDLLEAFLNGICRFYSKEKLESALYMHNRLIKFINDGGYYFTSHFIIYINDVNTLLKDFILYGKIDKLENLYNFYLVTQFNNSLNHFEKCEKVLLYMLNNIYEVNEEKNTLSLK